MEPMTVVTCIITMSGEIPNVAMMGNHTSVKK